MTGAVSSTGTGVSMRGVTKRYGETIALAGLDLDAPAGVITGIAGPNGAGKSTMVRILAGETARDDGDILLGGAPWDVDTANHAVAVVHQEPQLFPNLTVGNNIMVGREGVVARH